MYNPQSKSNTLQPSDTQPQGKRQQGSGFTNINRLLGANVGAGAAMGQQIGGNIGQQAGKVVQSADASTNKFLSDYTTSKGSALGTLSDISGLAGNVGTGGTVAAGSTLGGMTEGEAAQKGREFADVKYSGPTALSGAQKLTGQASTLGDTGKAAIGGSLGQKSLLQSMVAKPGQYTRGQSTLDTTLMGQSGQAQQALQQGAQQAFQAQKNVAAQQANAANLARQAASTIAQQKGDIGGLLNKNVQDIQSGAKMQADQYYTGAQTLQSALGKLASNKPLTPEETEALSMAQEYGIDTSMKVDTRYEDSAKNLLNQISGIGNTVNAGGMKYTPEQLAAQRNLQLIGQQEVIKPEDFNTNLFNADSDKIKTLGSYQAIKNQQLQNIKNLEAQQLRNLDSIQQVQPGILNLKDYQYYADNPFNTTGSREGGAYGAAADIYKRSGGKQYLNWSEAGTNLLRNKIKNYENEILNPELQAQRGITLRDYINKLANIEVPASQAGVTDKFGRQIG